jgi:hypothetical protein
MTAEPKQIEPVAGRLIPLVQFNKYYPDPTPAALRWLLFTKAAGFERCIVRRGRRILIDEAEYFRWLKSRNEKKT